MNLIVVCNTVTNSSEKYKTLKNAGQIIESIGAGRLLDKDGTSLIGEDVLEAGEYLFIAAAAPAPLALQQADLPFHFPQLSQLSQISQPIKQEALLPAQPHGVFGIGAEATVKASIDAMLPKYKEQLKDFVSLLDGGLEGCKSYMKANYRGFFET